MIPAGLVLVGVALVCAAGFVVAAARADARVHAVDPAATSRLEGAQRVWLLASVLCGMAAALLLVGAVAS